MRSVGYPSDATETLSVRTEDLDSSLPEGYVPHLIKIDVEGAEHLVLRGALRTLAAHRPLVLFEHQRRTASHYGSGPEEMFALLTGDAGMRIFDMGTARVPTRSTASGTRTRRARAGTPWRWADRRVRAG